MKYRNPSFFRYQQAQKLLVHLLTFMLGLNLTATVWAKDKDGGFGANKSDVEISLMYPPELFLTQRTFSLRFTGPETVKQFVVSEIRQLISRSQVGLSYVPEKGELQIALDASFDYSTQEFTRKVKVYPGQTISSLATDKTDVSTTEEGKKKGRGRSIFGAIVQAGTETASEVIRRRKDKDATTDSSSTLAQGKKSKDKDAGPDILGDDESPDTQKAVEEVHKFARVQAHFVASFDVQDGTLDPPISLQSGHTPWDVNQEVDLTAGKTPVLSELDAKKAALTNLVNTMRPLFHPQVETLKVMLGKVGDKLKPGIQLAEHGDWQGALNAWNAVSPFDEPKAEAYRVFNLGVANEALAHQSFRRTQDAAVALRYVDQAKELYERARQLKPEEKYFSQGWETFPAPLARVTQAQRAYHAWAGRQRAGSTEKAETGAPVRSSAPPQPAPPPPRSRLFRPVTLKPTTLASVTT